MEPAFGERLPGIDYVERPGAYAIILNAQGHMPIVHLGEGRHFLPGGGIEAGETPEHCLIREIAEELAHEARIGAPLGRTVQYVTVSRRGGALAVLAHYFRAEIGARLPVEPEHEVLWLEPTAALPLLAREADRWLVATALGLSTD